MGVSLLDLILLHVDSKAYQFCITHLKLFYRYIVFVWLVGGLVGYLGFFFFFLCVALPVPELTL